MNQSPEESESIESLEPMKVVQSEIFVSENEPPVEIDAAEVPTEETESSTSDPETTNEGTEDGQESDDSSDESE